MISARNQIKGKIKAITLGTVMAEVVVDVGPFDIVSAITRGSVEQMQLKVGDEVRTVIKATEVLVAKD